MPFILFSRMWSAHANITTDTPSSPDYYPPGSYHWCVYCLLAVICVVVSGLASGMNIGLMSISPLSLRIFAEAPQVDVRRDATLRLQQRRAQRVLPLVTRRYLVLVTLLLTTANADEVLPLCIDAIAPTWVAIVLSVVMMLVFTEVLPTAFFTDHRSNLKLAAMLSPFVWTLILSFGVLTWPLSKCLEWFVERAQRRVSDGMSLAESNQSEPDGAIPSNDRGANNGDVETRDLLRVGRMRSLTALMYSESVRRSVAVGPKRATDDHLTLQQIALLRNVVEFRQWPVSEFLVPASACVVSLEELAQCGDQCWIALLVRRCTEASGALRPWFIVEALQSKDSLSMFLLSEVLGVVVTRSTSCIDVLVGLHHSGRSVTLNHKNRSAEHGDPLLCSDTYQLTVGAAMDWFEQMSNDRSREGDGGGGLWSQFQMVLCFGEGGTGDSKVSQGDDAAPFGPLIGVVSVKDGITRGIQRPPTSTAGEGMPSHRRRDEDTTAWESDEDENDVEALLMGPRLANATPWSVHYAQRF